MRTCYVVMSEFASPVMICIPTPKKVFLKRKDAEMFCKEHNENRRTSTEYYIRKAQMDNEVER